MAVKLSPVYMDAQFINGVPAVGAQLFTYAAGSTTKQVTYSDSSGTVPNSNPIILNARGEPPAIWLSAGQAYKFVLSSPTDSDPPTSPIRVIDNISGVNDTSINIDEWAASNLTPTYLSATQFTLPGDQTSAFQVNRRVKLLVSAGTVYGYISASSFTTLTTVTVSLDSGSLDEGLSQVSLALLGATNPSVPGIIDSIFRIVKSTAISVFAKFDLSGLTATRTISLPDKSGTLAMLSDLVSQIVASGTAVKINRQNSTDEGAQLEFARAVDNATGFYLDVTGNDTLPILRVVAKNYANSGTEAVIKQSDSYGAEFSPISGASGVFPEFKCRGFCNFSGVGSISIRGTGNVLGIARIGLGDYEVTLANSMPDQAFACPGSAIRSDQPLNTLSMNAYPIANNKIKIFVNRMAGGVNERVDCDVVSLSIFR